MIVSGERSERVDWIRDNLENLAILVCAVIGVVIIAGSNRAKWSKVMSTVGIVCVGLALIFAPMVFRNFAESAATGIGAEADQ